MPRSNLDTAVHVRRISSVTKFMDHPYTALTPSKTLGNTYTQPKCSTCAVHPTGLKHKLVLPFERHSRRFEPHFDVSSGRKRRKVITYLGEEQVQVAHARHQHLQIHGRQNSEVVRRSHHLFVTTALCVKWNSEMRLTYGSPSSQHRQNASRARGHERRKFSASERKNA